MAIKLPIPPAIPLEARSHAEKRLGFEFDRFHLGNEQRTSMIAIGTVGQLVFKDYLYSKNINFDFQYQFGKYDDFDFKSREKIIEVKTSGFKNDSDWQNLNGIYNSSQLEKALTKKFYCSVQIFINGYDKVNKLFNINKCDTAIIAGWCEIEEILQYPSKYLPLGKAHLIPLSQLRPIDSLIALIK